MSLSAAQIEILKDPATRSKMPAQAANFAYADEILKESGPTCSRLVHVWNTIFNESLKTTLPIKAGPPPSEVNHSVVLKAMRMIQSYRKVK